MDHDDRAFSSRERVRELALGGVQSNPRQRVSHWDPRGLHGGQQMLAGMCADGSRSRVAMQDVASHRGAQPAHDVAGIIGNIGEKKLGRGENPLGRRGQGLFRPEEWDEIPAAVVDDAVRAGERNSFRVSDKAQ